MSVPGRFSKSRAVFHILIISLAVSFLFLAAQDESSGGRNGILFSHSFHLELGVQCENCHVLIGESESAQENNLPSKESCQACHDVEDAESCGVCHIRPESAVTFDNPKRAIKFSHRAHLGVVELAERLKESLSTDLKIQTNGSDESGLVYLDNSCTACHRGMETAALAGPDNLPDMADCLICHEMSGNAMDHCETCHTESNLFPVTHQTETFYDDHSADEASFDVAECRQCHTPGFNPCSQCH